MKASIVAEAEVRGGVQRGCDAKQTYALIEENAPAYPPQLHSHLYVGGPLLCRAIHSKVVVTNPFGREDL